MTLQLVAQLIEISAVQLVSSGKLFRAEIAVIEHGISQSPHILVFQLSKGFGIHAATQSVITVWSAYRLGRIRHRVAGELDCSRLSSRSDALTFALQRQGRSAPVPAA